MIASAAATLLLDKLRRRTGIGEAAHLPASLSDRLDFKAGQVDPKTGNRSASAQLQLSERILLLGDVDTAGDYRGLVRFLIRMR